MGGQRLTLELLKKLDDSLKGAILQQAAFFEHRLQMGSKPVFHIEAFVAKVAPNTVSAVPLARSGEV